MVVEGDGALAGELRTGRMTALNEATSFEGVTKGLLDPGDGTNCVLIEGWRAIEVEF